MGVGVHGARIVIQAMGSDSSHYSFLKSVNLTIFILSILMLRYMLSVNFIALMVKYTARSDISLYNPYHCF